MRRLASLTSRLVVTAVLLVALVSLLIGVTTTLFLRDYLTDRLDEQIRAALDREMGGPRTGGPGGFEGVGTLTAVVSEDLRLGRVIVAVGRRDLGRHEVPEEVLTVLWEEARDGHVVQTDLPGLGRYRVLAEEGTYDVIGDGSDEPVTGRLVVGLPSAGVEETIAELVLRELVFGLLAVTAAAGIGFVLVRRQLAPLREVAATAHEVAALPLDSGEVDLSPRVPHPDADTEVGRVGAALNALLAHVETSLTARHRSEQQVRQFVADASHELRTPLTTIRGYAELSRRQPDDPAALSASLAKVSTEADRMAALVDDLLLLARLDAGRPLDRAPVDLTRLLLETVGDARVVGPDHQWRLELPDEPLEVAGDEQRLHQVVTNLLTNAQRHTPPGTTVTVSARRTTRRTGPAAAVELVVADDGPGFPPDLAGSAFERFTRGDAARTRASGGAGLGLSIVAAIVRAHGGEVHLASSPGSTRVTVRLPVAQACSPGRSGTPLARGSVRRTSAGPVEAPKRESSC